MERQLDLIYHRSAKGIYKKWQDYMKSAQRRIAKAEKNYRDAQMSGTPEDIKIMRLKLEEVKRNATLFDSAYRQMVEETTRQLASVNQSAIAYVNGQMVNVYTINFNADDIEKEIQKTDINFGVVDEYTVRRRIIDGEIKLPARQLDTSKDKTWNMKQINSSVLQGILQGETMGDIAKRILPVVGRNQTSAIRTARTLTTQAENRGRIDRYHDLKNDGVDMLKVWIATADSRTRDSHLELDGKTARINQKFDNGLVYPGDPNGTPAEVYNCRCTLGVKVIGFVSQTTGEYIEVEDYAQTASLHDDQIQKERERREQETMTTVNAFQSALGRSQSVNEVNNLMNSQGWFRTNRAGIASVANLTGCDLDSAKSIAAAYNQIFEKYPQLIGRFDAPDAQPKGMKAKTYAWCYIRTGGKVQVNPNIYNDWQSLVKQYDDNVRTGWHPYGTTAESIVTHEIGHAIDGLLAKEGILGGYTKSGEFRYASSSLKQTIMNRVAKVDENVAYNMSYDRIHKTSFAVEDSVSQYAAENSKEWFAECFAEYITSANPRIVASTFGKELENLLGRLK